MSSIQEGVRIFYFIEIPVDTITVCDKHDGLCRNGGTCVDDEEDFYYCLCAPGWYGVNCEKGNFEVS